MADEKKKKIIVDEDWKVQAQREKENLAAEQEAEHVEHVEPEEAAPQSLPPADFSGLITMLATQTLYALGVIQPQGHEPRQPDFMMAQYNIDMLGVIQEKTKGNLSKEEETLLLSALSQVRMAFVQVSGLGQGQDMAQEQ